MNRENSTISEISPSQMKSMLKADNSHWVLDVRENWEREIQCIEPSTHIPLGEFSDPENIKLPKEISKNSSIIIYCKAGVRSRTACEVLFSLGYKNLFNLSGGMIEWEEDNS
jgi:rhodanese-related sulfurtransferase